MAVVQQLGTRYKKPEKSSKKSIEVFNMKSFIKGIEAFSRDLKKAQSFRFKFNVLVQNYFTKMHNNTHHSSPALKF